MIESNSLEREKPNTKKFNTEFTRAIQSLMKRGYHPTPDNIFSFIRTHPGDFPYMMRIILLGKEPLLRVYLTLWGKVRGSIEKRLTPQEARDMSGDHLGLATREDAEGLSGEVEVDVA